MTEIARKRQHEHQDTWDKFWKDKHGDVVVYQRPSVLLIGWLVLTLASLFVNGTASSVLWWIALGILTVWALLEIWKGVNYFRRVFGALMLILVALAVLKVGY